MILAQHLFPSSHNLPYEDNLRSMLYFRSEPTLHDDGWYSALPAAKMPRSGRMLNYVPLYKYQTVILATRLNKTMGENLKYGGLYALCVYLKPEAEVDLLHNPTPNTAPRLPTMILRMSRDVKGRCRSVDMSECRLYGEEQINLRHTFNPYTGSTRGRTTAYDPPLAEFTVLYTSLDPHYSEEQLQPAPGPTTGIVLEGEVHITTADKAGIYSKAGDVIFVTAAQKFQLHAVARGPTEIF
ncbi:hypothetical protein BU17DRAFT_84748 [Hysterangium stoloniferum]|nr:hypothetical protein BU17DRAFT_84748 [Hysterangium stoloniferum]